MAKVILNGVTKVYNNGFKAVDNVSLEINHNEFMVFVGPSGCGKTSLLRMIAGLEAITQGQIYIDDILVNQVEPKDRQVAMVFQNYALFPHMSNYENIAYGLKRHGESKAMIDERVHEAAKILNLEKHLDLKPGQLSGGQKQRVALGRAMVMNPKVFLMDEPLSNLDTALKGQMRKELMKIHKRLETTFIYVTHDQTEAMTMGTRICVINDGCIQQVDTPNQIYNKPGNTFVAEFIGTPKINLIDPELVNVDGASDTLVFEYGPLRIVTQKTHLTFNVEDHLNGITIGIRPQDIEVSLRGMEGNSQGQGEFEIELIELLGSECILHLKNGSSTLIALVPNDPKIKVGHFVHVKVKAEKCHFFDSEKGFRL